MEPLHSSLKVFINICHDEKVPKPDIDFNPSVVYPLIMENQWEIPIITSSIRKDKDKKGILCYVWDCCINTKCMEWVCLNVQLREILVEWCLESCELSDMVEISRDNLSFPRMKKKGETIPPLEVLSEVLKRDHNKDMADFAKDEQNDPISILNLKRSLITQEEDQSMVGTNDRTLPPLFPSRERHDSNKPLIQEIDALTIDDKIKKKAKPSQEPKDINFEVSIRKTKDSKEYKLRVEIMSEVESGSDLRILYEAQQNSLLVKNVNLDRYKEKELNIPLPNIFSNEDINSMRCFFIKNARKLVIFV